MLFVSDRKFSAISCQLHDGMSAIVDVSGVSMEALEVCIYIRCKDD